MPKRMSHGHRRPTKYTDARGKTRWRVQIDIGVTPEGKRKRKTVTALTYRECDEKRRELEHQLSMGKTPTGLNVTLGEYAERWLHRKRQQVDPSTYKSYRIAIRKHCESILNVRLDEITPDIIYSVLDDMRDEGISISTRRTLRIVLNMLFKAAVQDRCVQYNPVSGVEPPRAKDKVINQACRPFNVDEIKRMLEVAASKPITEGAWWWWRLLTGMRQGELIGSTWDSLDMIGPSPRYRVLWQMQSIPARHGCGKPDDDGKYKCGNSAKFACNCPKVRWLIPDGADLIQVKGSQCLVRPKSATVHIVPIIPKLAEVLQRYWLVVKDYPNPHNLMFVNPDGTPMWEARKEKAAFDSFQLECGINPKLHRGHDTRSTLVTLLRGVNVDQKVVMSIVGHSSVAVDDLYFAVDDSLRMGAMMNVDSALNLKQIEWNGEKR